MMYYAIHEKNFGKKSNIVGVNERASVSLSLISDYKIKNVEDNINTALDFLKCKKILKK